MTLPSTFDAALAQRLPLVEPHHTTAFRAFSGFYEGLPALSVDVFGKTVVLLDHTDGSGGDEALAREALEAVKARFPFVNAALWKLRNAKDEASRKGRMLWGDEALLCRRITENGVRYTVDLRLNRDVGFYLDTRGLRAWAKETLGGKRVLNTFAYTGSLGVAARAGEAAKVVHTDLNRSFLNVAKDSYTLNGFPVEKADFQVGDFFDVAGRLKREGALFDCVFVDPPFFSTTIKGTVDLSADPRKLIDKVRPLVAHQGLLVVVNNALFLPGKDFEGSLREVCADGYATLERTFEVPPDVTGYAATRVGTPPVDPAPFNHPTKMALLKLTRKDGRTEALPKAPKPAKAKKAAAVVDDEDDAPEFPR